VARVTIKDIARRAGVSKTAVSFAFNDPTRLSEATVEKILRVAEELGYAPHPVARSLSMRRTDVIGVLVPQDIATMLENPFFTQFLRGIGQVCLEEGVFVLLAAPVQGSLQNAVDRATVDGFVAMGLGAQDPVMELLQRRDIPFVLVDSEPLDGVPSVNVDDRVGARAVMQYVLGQGHRRLAILGFESGANGVWQHWSGTLQWRLEGYAEALTSTGLSPESPNVHILECENNLEGGEEAFRRLWEMSPRPTAVVAMSDIMALGILKAARDRGIEVPRQFSIVGYDDVPEAWCSIPPLTTVHQPSVRKGEQATELLVRLLAGEAVNEHITLPTKLVVRASVVAPPSP
jgi:DNA-binding LacI/PurR family transcriptional regulator